MESKTKKISIELKNMNSTYHENEIIYGLIKINDFENSDKNEIIDLTVNMKENWSSFNIKKIIVQQKIKIDSNENDFEIQLPENLIPSYEFPGKSFEAFIRYEIIASYKNITISKYLLIKSIYKGNPEEIKKEFNINVNSIFSNYGNCNGTIIMKNNFYKIGEKTIFFCKINNQTKINVEKLKIDFKRKFIFKNNNNEVEKEFLHKIIESNVIWLIKPNEEKEYNFFMNLRDNDLMKNFDLKNWELKNPYNEINDLNELFPSFKSYFIECEYYLKITVYFSKRVYHDSRPRIKIPIIIYHISKEEYEQKINSYEQKNNNLNENIENNENNIPEKSILLVNGEISVDNDEESYLNYVKNRK